MAHKVGKSYEGTYLKDGTKVLCLTMQENGDIVKGYKVNPDGTTINLTPGQTVNPQINYSFWNCFTSCLSANGAAAWMIAMVASVCQLVCIDFPNPVGCGSCAAAAVIGLGSIGIYCAWNC